MSYHTEHFITIEQWDGNPAMHSAVSLTIETVGSPSNNVPLISMAAYATTPERDCTEYMARYLTLQQLIDLRDACNSALAYMGVLE